MSNSWKPYAEWDLVGTDLLPADWEQSVRRAIDAFGAWTYLSGDSVVSREDKLDRELPVLVVTGEVIRQQLPWLRQLYVGHLCSFAANWFGQRLFIAKDERSSININCLRGVGARYEAHVDSNTVTGVLFVTTHLNDAGGSLVFRGANDVVASLSPSRGVFAAFDAREITHYVEPLLVNVDRISIPMNYYDDPVNQERPPGLDEYLYSPKKSL
jgi:hypothetical protein